MSIRRILLCNEFLLKPKVVREHIQDGRTLTSLAAEYGVSKATVSNWVRAYRASKDETCQQIKEIYHEFGGIIGHRAMRVFLARKGIKSNKR